MQSNITIQFDQGRTSQLKAIKLEHAIKLRLEMATVNFVCDTAQLADLRILRSDELINSDLNKCLALPRGEDRSILLLKKSVADKTQQQVTALTNLDCDLNGITAFIKQATPTALELGFEFSKSDTLDLLTKYESGTFAAMLVALADLELLLDENYNSCHAELQAIRQILSASIRIIIPRSKCPALPAQGSIVATILSDHTRLTNLMTCINHQTSLAIIKDELDLVQTNKDCKYATIIERPFGRIRYRKIKDHVLTDLLSCRPILPRAKSLSAIWPSQSDRAFKANRSEINVCKTSYLGNGLLVSRIDALPTNWQVDQHTPVWTAGLESWQNLIKRGIWVSGCSEKLGECELERIKFLFPELKTWLKLTHSQGHTETNSFVLKTYQLETGEPIEPLDNKTHFFWSSASRFKAALMQQPEIINGWHACGPGNSYQMIAELIPNQQQLAVFLSHNDFIEAVKPI